MKCVLPFPVLTFVCTTGHLAYQCKERRIEEDQEWVDYQQKGSSSTYLWRVSVHLNREGICAYLITMCCCFNYVQKSTAAPTARDKERAWKELLQILHPELAKPKVAIPSEVDDFDPDTYNIAQQSSNRCKLVKCYCDTWPWVTCMCMHTLHLSYTLSRRSTAAVLPATCDFQSTLPYCSRWVHTQFNSPPTAAEKWSRPNAGTAMEACPIVS